MEAVIGLAVVGAGEANAAAAATGAATARVEIAPESTVLPHWVGGGCRAALYCCG
jgi:hypothetical protein